MTKLSPWYSVVEDGEHNRYRYDGLSISESTVPDTDLAEICAEDYHDHHDGWESSWPLTFVLYGSEDGPALARFEIDRETRPDFVVTRIMGEKPGKDGAA